MKKFWGLILFIFLMSINQCYAARFDFLVLPADLFVNDKEYLVFPKSANLISTDIINYYNQQPYMSAVQINQIKTYLEKPENYRLKKEVQTFLVNYRDNYAIDFNMVQKLASIFKAKQVLLISCNMDAQNYITRRTMWDFLDVPGATVIDPAYRLSTQVTLIDPNNQSILWKHNYQKLISSRENRIIPTTYNDAAEQLEKVNKYSTKFLAPQIVQETQLALQHVSQYSNLKLHPEIVKSDYVSIDKVKIDSKRGMVKSGRFIKNKSALAGASIASGIVSLFHKRKSKIKKLSVDEKIQKMHEKEQVKFELQKAKQRLKYEKQIQKQQLNATKKQMQQEAKLQLKQQQQELKQQQIRVQTTVDEKVREENISPVNNTQPVKETQIIEKKSKGILRKIKSAKETPAATEIQTVPSPVIMQQNLKPVPYIKTK
ncbi:hypothetical protein IJ707_03755, partial [bacterium]|nr:hypothetical protein [bacterium]